MLCISGGVVVARVLAKLEPGGAQLGVLRTAIALRAYGIFSRVLAGQATPEGLELFRRAGVPVDVWGGGDGLQYHCSPGFADWLAPRLASVDIVHAHMFGAWWAAAQVVPPGVALVASEHNAVRWPGCPHWREWRAAIGRVELFYAHGPASAATALRHGLSPARLREGRSPVPQPPAAVRARAGLPSPRVVFVGRLHEEKGPDVLVEAVSLLRGRLHAFLLGTGPQEPALRMLAARHGMTDAVRFAGWQDEPEGWLAGASACVVPSRHDAWSQTAVMAMALGTPVIASAVEGLPEVVGGGRGVLVPPGDPTALALALERALAGRLGVDTRAAREYARRFEPGRVAGAYAADYRSLAGSLRQAA